MVEANAVPVFADVYEITVLERVFPDLGPRVGLEDREHGVVEPALDREADSLSRLLRRLRREPEHERRKGADPRLVRDPNPFEVLPDGQLLPDQVE